MTDFRVYQDDYLFDSGDSGRLDAIAQSMPNALTRGSTIVIDGRPQFKSSPQITCPRCGCELRPGITTIRFRFAAPESREQLVFGWRCECGECYVPGDVARQAYQRAITKQPAHADDTGRGVNVPSPVDHGG